jgi:hypothetical protein
VVNLRPCGANLDPQARIADGGFAPFVARITAAEVSNR